MDDVTGTTGDAATGDGRALRWAGHREARRLELVDIAIGAITEHGPDVTTEQIAAAAGVSRPGLYRHFEGKDDLQAAIADRSVQRLVEDLEPVWRPSGRPSEMLERALRSHLRWLVGHANVYRYLRRASLPSGGEVAAANVRTTVSAHVAAMLADGSLGPPIEPSVAHPLAFGLVGLVDAAAGHWLEEPHGADEHTLGSQLTTACRAVIAATVGPMGEPPGDRPGASG